MMFVASQLDNEIVKEHLGGCEELEEEEAIPRCQHSF